MICLTESSGLLKLQQTLYQNHALISFHESGKAGNQIEYILTPKTTLEMFNDLFNAHSFTHYYLTFNILDGMIKTTVGPDLLKICETNKNIFGEHGIGIDHYNHEVYEVTWTTNPTDLLEDEILGCPAIYIPHEYATLWRPEFVFYRSDNKKGSW